MPVNTLFRIPLHKSGGRQLQATSSGRVCGGRVAELTHDESACPIQLEAAQAVSDGLPAAEQDFAFRQLVVDRLDVMATLTVEEGLKWVDASLVIRKKARAIAFLNIPDSERNKRAEVVLRRRFQL